MHITFETYLIPNKTNETEYRALNSPILSFCPLSFNI
jgi:hypothetical protein